MAVSIGDQVRLLRAQPYLKSADPMPMLRPPDPQEQLPEELAAVSGG